MNGDTSERKLAQEVHGNGEQRLRTITDNLSEGLVIASTDGQLLHWNKASRVMFGFDSEEDGLRNLLEFVDTFELSTLDGRLLKLEEWPLTRVIAGERLHDLELRLWRFGSDRSFVLSFTGALVEDEGGKSVAFLSFADITERKRNEEALLTSLKEVNELRTALDEHAIVAITDPQGKITFVNDKFCTISQYAREELLGQDHRIINSGFHPKEFIRDIWTTIAHGKVWHGEIKNKAKDGSFYWVDTTIVPFLNEQGKPRQYVAIRADITERKRVEASLEDARTGLERRVSERTAELAEAKEHAESANLSKSEFLANMSHELRTPLNGVIGISSFLVTKKPGPLNAKQLEYLTDIQNSGNHLLQLVNDVLDLSKVEAGKMELFPEEFFLTQAVEELCAIMSPEAKRKKITIQTEISPAVERVILDQQKFKQVLFNLLSNAVKFTEDGGRVEIVAARDHDRLRVQVRDTGIGIKPEDFGKLFVEFQQLDSGLSRRHQGTGLGLAVSRKIVEFQGGTITLESEPGKGSTFTVRLPHHSRIPNPKT